MTRMTSLVKQEWLIRLPWLVVLLTGLALFGAAFAVLIATADPVYVPCLLLLGAAVVPVTFSVLVNDYEHERRFSPLQVLTVAVVGGILAALIAGPLELAAHHGLGTLPSLMIGVIEESAKLVVPLVVALRVRGTRAGDGLVVGVAVGSVFAALETVGYGFVALIATRGQVEPVAQLLLLRAVGSLGGPHAEWDAPVAHDEFLVVGAISFACLIVTAWWLRSFHAAAGTGPTVGAWGVPRVPLALNRAAGLVIAPRRPTASQNMTSG
jgi:protease PrsW